MPATRVSIVLRAYDQFCPLIIGAIDTPGVEIDVRFRTPLSNEFPQGLTMIVVTHEIGFATEAADRVFFSAERVLKAKADSCAAAGKPTTVQSFPDQNGAILAVRSKRSDGFFSGQAPLTYFVGQSPDTLDLAGANLPNGFGDVYQGAIAPKDSDMSKAVLAAFQELFDNGTYEKIMKKWGIERNMLKKPGINLAPDTEHFKSK